MASIIFDFDGTIADSRDLVIDFLSKEALKYPLTPAERHSFYGLTMFEIVKKLQLPWWRFPSLLFKGRESLSKSIPRLKPYDGITDVIKKIHNEGHQIFIVSSNSLNNIKRFLRRYKIQKDIFAIYGGIEIFGKEHTFKDLIKEFNLDTKQIICIGDEVRDIEAASAVKLRTIAVSWGFSNIEHLHSARPTWIVESPNELLKLVEQA
ncbi:MAG TPA: HAD-IA family hydrolase [Patescibacteria group bacterium]|nr:HAD-IA family hydrolase [Patescibacteria group bacterium]